MTTIFSWKIAQMDRTPSDGFVIKVHYRVDAFDGTLGSGLYNSVEFKQQQGESFVPFEQLTEDQVVSWVQNSVGKDLVEAELQARIDEQKVPTRQTGLPWAQPTEE